MTKRILLIDDEPVVQIGLQEIIKQSPETTLLCANDLDEACNLLESESIQLILMELQNNHGVHGVERIRKRFASIAFVVFSSDVDSYTVTKTVRAGALGYIDKSCDPASLRASIEIALQGDQVWPEGNQKQVNMGRLGERVQLNEYMALTNREFDVLKQLCEGHTNRKIAEVLSISYETVKEHVQNILQKMAMSDRTQVAVWAVSNGIIEPETI